MEQAREGRGRLALVMLMDRPQAARLALLPLQVELLSVNGKK